MAWRAIQDNVGRSESLAKVDDTARAMFFFLLAHTDSHGRLAGSPAKLRAHCFPLLEWTHEQVGWALHDLEQVRRIWVYDVDGTVVVQIADFEENQPGELLRKRGASRLPESKTLKAGALSDYSGTLYKLPANRDYSRTTPDEGRPRAGKSREEESKDITQQQQDAREPHSVAAASDRELLDLLERLGIAKSLRVAACADPERAKAWANKALTDATSNPGGYFRIGLESGDWPTATVVSHPYSKPRDPAALIRRQILNGALTGLVDLDAELAAHPALTLAECEQLRRLLTGKAAA